MRCVRLTTAFNRAHHDPHLTGTRPRLACALDCRPPAPVTAHEMGLRGDRAPPAAIDTRDRMALGQQLAHDTRTDMPRSPHDTDMHRVAPPAAHCSTSGPAMQYRVC